MKTTKEKIEVMQAFEQGELIEIADYSGGIWIDEQSPRWEWGKFDYRVKQQTPEPIAPPVIPGFELVPETSNELPNVGWMYLENGKIFDVETKCFLSVKCHFINSGGIRFYRPVRKPKMPDGVFWVRNAAGCAAQLVGFVYENNKAYMLSGGYCLEQLDDVSKKGKQWSHDRVTWYDFYGEKVS